MRAAFGSGTVGTTSVTGVADDRTVTDAAITSGQSTLTSSSAAFTTADVGRAVVVAGAGSGGGTMSFTITAVSSGTTATLNRSATTTVSGAVARIGTDNSKTIQAAINAVSAAGGGTVYLPPGKYPIVLPIFPRSNVTLRGAGISTEVYSLDNWVVISTDATGWSDFTVEELVISGPFTNRPTVPTYARTSVGLGTTHGISTTGSLDPSVPGSPVNTNLTVRRVVFRDLAGLPTRIFGISGKTLITECEAINTRDIATGYCQEAIITNCTSRYGWDNGISCSRGTFKVVITGNTVENTAFHGLAVGGWASADGGEDSVISGNTVRGYGNCGIAIQYSPSYVTISGNTIDNPGQYRGAVDQPTDIECVGILVRGNPDTDPTNYTSHAKGMVITGNQIVRASRAGIMYSGLDHALIADNLILDCGTQYMANGTTAVSSTDKTNNVGVLCDYPTTVTNVIVRDNVVIDSRATAYCNYAVQPIPTPAGVTVFGNIARGLRNQPQTAATARSDTLGLLEKAIETLPRWAAVSASISMGSGVVRFGYFTARRTETVTKLRLTCTTAAGATPSLVRFGLYSVDSSTGNLTQVGQTASDTTIFAAAGNYYERALTSSATLVEGQRYAVAAIVVTAASAPNVSGMIGGAAAEMAQSPRLCAALTAQSDLSASYTAGSLADSTSMIYAAAVQ